MAADIKKLITQLRKQVPEVNHNPLLDEIETAYDDEESGEDADEAGEAADGKGDDAEGEDPSEADAYGQDAEDAADGGADDAEEGDAPPPPPKKGAPAAKGRSMPKMSKMKPFM